MAKTFKKALLTEPVAPVRPASERDFFDINDDPRPAAPLGAGLLEKRNTGNTNTRIKRPEDNKGNTGNSGTTVNTGNKGLSPENLASVDTDTDGVRQTFVVSKRHLEHLRDYVHARRTQGEYTYSQKQALQEALDLLFAGTTAVAPRPVQAREREQQHRQRIQQGRRSRDQDQGR